MDKFIHLIPTKTYKSFRLFSVLIPILIFILITVLLLRNSKKNVQTAATTQVDTAILGEETENISK